MALDNKQSQLYGKTGTISEFDLEEGLFPLPVAEEDTGDPDWSSVDIVRAHSPFRKRRVTFRGEKNGSPPVLPSPADTGAFRFLGGTIAFPPPQFDSTGSQLNWSAYGEYTFVEDCRSNLSDGFVLGLNVPFATALDKQAVDNFQPAETPYGAVAQAGNEAKIGYTVGESLTLSDPFFSYNVPAFWPSVFFDQNILNGQIDLSDSQSIAPQFVPAGMYVNPEYSQNPEPERVSPPIQPLPPANPRC